MILRMAMGEVEVDFEKGVYIPSAGGHAQPTDGLRVAVLPSSLLVEGDAGKVTLDRMANLHDVAKAAGCGSVLFVPPGSPVLCLGLREPSAGKWYTPKRSRRVPIGAPS